MLTFFQNPIVHRFLIILYHQQNCHVCTSS